MKQVQTNKTKTNTKNNRTYAEPYRQSGSVIYAAFTACKKGIHERDLVKLIQKLHGQPYRIIIAIKRGADKQSRYQWDVHDTDGFLKITNIRPIPRIE